LNLDKRKLQEAEWHRQFELTPEQFNKLIQSKIKRASEYHNVKLKPERDFSVA